MRATATQRPCTGLSRGSSKAPKTVRRVVCQGHARGVGSAGRGHAEAHALRRRPHSSKSHVAGAIPFHTHRKGEQKNKVNHKHTLITKLKLWANEVMT